MSQSTDPDDVFLRLVALNPKARKDVLQMYSNAFSMYAEASKNIKENGAIVYHPRTGAPVDNPYLRVQSAQGAILRKIRINTGDLWG